MRKKLIREGIAFLFRYLGLSFILRNTLLKNKTTIITYHDPSAEDFETHLRFLSKRYCFITLSKLVDAVKRQDWQDIPKNSMVITIDDGHKGNYKLLDICKKYHVVPMIYLCSEVINTNRHFWWLSGFQNVQALKRIRNCERLNILKTDCGYEPDKEYPDRQALNISEIKAMSPYFEFGSHTNTHPILTECTDTTCEDEIRGSKQKLEKMLQSQIIHFSYPNGDYGKREVSIAQNSQYESVRTIDKGWVDVHSDVYSLKAAVIDDNASLNVLNAQCCFLFKILGQSK